MIATETLPLDFKNVHLNASVRALSCASDVKPNLSIEHGHV